MACTVVFHAFCSKTRRKFFVEAEVVGQTLVWKDAFTMVGNGEGMTPTGELEAAQHDARNFKCPCCQASIATKKFAFWNCYSCGVNHCSGDDKGVLHGACGHCDVSETTLQPATAVKVTLADSSQF